MSPRAAALAVVAAVLGAGAPLAADDPEVKLRPVRKIWSLPAGACEVDVTFRLEIVDGGDERYYCPEVEWEWEDGSRSSSESDCPPFDEADEDRRFVRRKTHGFKNPGHWTITVRLFKADELIHEEETDVLVTGFEGMDDGARAAHCR